MIRAAIHLGSMLTRRSRGYFRQKRPRQGRRDFLRYHTRRMTETIHHLLATWMQFILDWGYLGVFVMVILESTAVPIPAEVIIPPAAFWAAQGRFHLWAIILAATAGSWVGSAISYAVAKKIGRPLVENRPLCTDAAGEGGQSG